MFSKEDCCFEQYSKMLSWIKESGKYMDYAEAIHADKFLVLRHDIEFSVKRAYDLSLVETNNGICSSYLVQFTNNAYNAFSSRNLKMLKEMISNGHKVGLHYHRNGIEDLEEVKKDILLQADILSTMLNCKVDRFSFHRPLRAHLEANIHLNGLINMYGNEFFVLTDDASEELAVKYIADSNHQWKYGIPGKECFEKYDKIQLLVHPLSWTQNGAEHVECFQEIVQEKRQELLETIEGEWKIFDQLRGKL